MNVAERLESDLDRAWNDALESIESARMTSGLEHDDASFRRRVTLWFGDDGYDSYRDWFESGLEE